MTDTNASAEVIDFFSRLPAPPETSGKPSQSARDLHSNAREGYGGGEPPGGKMESNLGHRLSKLEGITTGYKFALATVSAVLIGGMGVLVTVMFAVRSDVTDLRDRVNSIPGEINQNLLELNRTMSESITAARSSSEAPQVIVIERANEAAPGDQ